MTDSLKQDSLRMIQDQDQSTVKAKKRNIFVRFFRWLFGIERRQRKRAEREQALTDSLTLKSKADLKVSSDSIHLEIDSLDIHLK